MIPENDPSRAFILRAQELHRQNKFDAALEMMERGLRKHRDNGYLHAFISGLYSKRNDHERAIMHGKKAIELRPQDTAGYDVLIKAYRKSGQKDLVKQIELQRPKGTVVVEYNQSAPYADVVKNAEGLVQTGRHAEAFDLLRDAVKEHGFKWDIIKIAYGAGIRAERENETMVLLLTWRTACPELAQARYLMGELCTRMNEPAQALTYFQEAWNLAPSNGNFQYAYFNAALKDAGTDMQKLDELLPGIRDYLDPDRTKEVRLRHIAGKFHFLRQDFFLARAFLGPLVDFRLAKGNVRNGLSAGEHGNILHLYLAAVDEHDERYRAIAAWLGSKFENALNEASAMRRGTVRRGVERAETSEAAMPKVRISNIYDRADLAPLNRDSAVVTGTVRPERKGSLPVPKPRG